MEAQTLLEMTGTVEHITFRNECNGYTVLELNNGEELVTVVGSMPTAEPGDELHVVGQWTEHPSFGRQFSASIYERMPPATTESILLYLSSGAVRGIGRAMAKKIVSIFGSQSLQIMEREPLRLAEISGISQRKAEQIGQEYRKKLGIREVILGLKEFGMKPEESVRIYRTFGPDSVSQVRSDPYCLCEDDVGLSFQRADGIAETLEHPADDPCRVRAGILYVLQHNVNNGHTCLPKEKLLPTAARMLGLPQELLDEVFSQMVQEGSVIICTIQDRTAAYLPRLYRAEVFAAQRLQMMMDYPSQPIPDAQQAVEEFESKIGISYADEQKEAIITALTHGMLVLTGGPGTGKTTTLNAIIRILQAKGEKVLLAAPTGRAAKRMSELTGEEAKTLHRLLQVEWDETDSPTFARNEQKPLECDALIVDELSMVDISLFEALLRALPMGCRLVLVGDCDQLPSVGPGNVLGDLIASGMLPVVQLQRIFRQSMQSLIVTNAHRILAGEMPVLNDCTHDFFFMQRSQPEQIAQTIRDLCAVRLPASYDLSPMTDIQVLSPTRKTQLGTVQLNTLLQNALNPREHGKKEIKINGRLFREGDKVMQTRNNYTLTWEKEDGSEGEGVFNGDIGILRQVDRGGSTITVDMDGRIVSYELETATDLELAYALTVHKSQGSEFPAVIMPMYPGPRPLYYRNLFYTAITRARKLLILVGTQRTVQMMVSNDRRMRRYSGLRDFLTGEAVPNDAS
ncbi:MULTISPECIES: ATP-dependent RecD-like DNA helicase [Caproicibacterium]|jgi:exodeoxyribonuclease V alpha subunit|uniref:ATP-dependent RecD2 DNA helicase n=1 Tax=Caproicibacterium lactatifermentans TaxID=2666138 RepID=A0A859DVS0_9FIRM|nr:ATP-dependent RecD-like DNA helicase [Caproicibacterium lactatifermentans]ARP49850.1 helicase [Ruminococcaceae bacterium CPB6]MDD4807201.1 ATP-dependent RecD-like DNA helicase [Oscillospiraceae bacterium]QKN24423.1 ATP-dependent RecD-like DNA helicase [Caproicibacterium lactatifermentans]QKO30564.1 ATP-dependent RecD-like DNA helicase [Caproicibacterium lactatifermentans]